MGYDNANILWQGANNINNGNLCTEGMCAGVRKI